MISSSQFKSRGFAAFRRNHAFTLIEVMMATTIGSLLLTGVLSTFLMLARSGVRSGNYSLMESQTRRAFEQLGIDTRTANNIISNRTGGVITSVTLEIPNQFQDDSDQVTFGYDTSNPVDKIFYMVPGTDPSSKVGRKDLINKVESMSFYRYTKANDVVNPAADDLSVKHLQISVSVSRATSGVAKATQVIRSSAFTLRNKHAN